MDDIAAHARTLLERREAHDAWQLAVAAARDADRVGDVKRVAYWRSVQQELLRTSPTSGPCTLDVFRSAQLLLGLHGEEGARREAAERLAAVRGDLRGENAMRQVAAAVEELARVELRSGERVH